MQRISPKKLTLHPEADQVPEMTDEQYESFLDNVREHGIRDPIEVLPGTLTVLDGRTRLRAAIEAGLPDVPIEDAQLSPGETPLAFMTWRALQRRHLDKNQRAMMAARAASLEKGRRAGESNASKEAFSPPTQAEAAQAVGIGRATVQRAKTVLEKGTPAEIKKVDDGEVTVARAAKIIRDKEKDVRDAAEADPGRFGDLGQKLDDGVAVERVHKELRKREKEGTQKRHVLLDATDHPVPAHLRDLFGDRWLRQTIEMVESLARDGVAKVIPKVKGKGPAYTHMKSNKVLEALDRARTELEIAHSLLNESKPHAVHRACEGKGCKDCARAGWVPKWRWVELKAEGKL
jgi:ParB-like chromosome segregation protein Spo0J